MDSRLSSPVAGAPVLLSAKRLARRVGKTGGAVTERALARAQRRAGCASWLPPGGGARICSEAETNHWPKVRSGRRDPSNRNRLRPALAWVASVLRWAYDFDKGPRQLRSAKTSAGGGSLGCCCKRLSSRSAQSRTRARLRGTAESGGVLPVRQTLRWFAPLARRIDATMVPRPVPSDQIKTPDRRSASSRVMVARNRSRRRRASVRVSSRRSPGPWTICVRDRWTVRAG